jgi:hypothetical protein
LKAVSKIYLTWRKGKGHRRHIIGVLRKNATEGVRFEYIKDNIPRASEDGFSPYVDFPDIDKIYKQNVIEIFGQRLVKAERADIQKYYDFWELDMKLVEDKYYMLAYTQGMLSTDNFELLADFHPIKDLCFVSEVTGLTERKIKSDSISVGDELRWIKECENEFDKQAIQLYKGSILIGYVKKIHNRVFCKPSKGRLRIVVKSVDQNGSINRIFIRIFF